MQTVHALARTTTKTSPCSSAKVNLFAPSPPDSVPSFIPEKLLCGFNTPRPFFCENVMFRCDLDVSSPPLPPPLADLADRLDLGASVPASDDAAGACVVVVSSGGRVVTSCSSSGRCSPLWSASPAPLSDVGCTVRGFVVIAVDNGRRRQRQSDDPFRLPSCSMCNGPDSIDTISFLRFVD